MATNRKSTPGGSSDRGRHSVGRVLIACAAVLSVVASAVALARWIPITNRFYTDAASIRVPADSVHTRDILWQPARSLSDLINTTADDYEPRLSADGMTLYFVRGKAGRNADIYVAVKQAGGWREPTPLADINSPHDELGPEPSADGASLFFYSDRPGGQGGYDLWVARRGADGWQSPINLGPGVNSEFNDYGPALTPDGGSLYFASNRPAPQEHADADADAWPATMREDLFERTYDLYVAPITDRGFGQAAAVAALNTPFNEGAPAVSSFGDFLYFASDRPGGEGAFDLYRSRRLRGAHEPPVNLGSSVNTRANELDPGLSLGGFALYFSSDRVRVMDDDDATASVASNDSTEREYNLYYTTSREVFSEVERVSRPPIDWAAIWTKVGPNLFWALLALLLILLLLALLRDLHQRRMGLLSKCVLASVMAHLLLLLLMNAWEVTATLARELHRRGPIRVALASQETGRDLASQFRGQLTSVAPPEAPSAELSRQDAPVEVHRAAAVASLSIERPRVRPRDESTWEAVPADSDVDARRDRPIETAVQVVFAPAATDTALPTESKPQRVTEVTEADVRAEVAPVEQLESPRAARTKTVADSDVAESIQTLAPVVAERPAGSSARERQSLVEPQIARDASAPPPPIPMPTTATVSSGGLNLPTPDVALPSGPIDRPPEVTETTPTIAVPASLATRSELPDTSSLDEATSASMPTLKPDAPRATRADQSLVPSTDVEPTDAATAARRSTTVTLQRLGEDRPVPAEIELPAPAGRVTDAEPREVVPETFADEPAMRRALAVLGGDETPPANRVTIAPQRSTATASPKSLFDADVDASASTPLPNQVAMLMPRPGDRDVRSDSPVLDLAVPSETRPPDNPYVQRVAENRMSIVERMGGSERTERAVADALRWLADHQSADGHWDGKQFDRSCGYCGGETNIVADNALTGLALLAFLGAGHTHATDGPYRSTVERGVRWLLGRQSADGDLRGKETMYSHGIATIALSEAYGMTGDERLADPVRRAVRFIDGSRNRDEGGWRYDPSQAGDTSVLGWMVMAMKSAMLNGVRVSTESFRAARAWLDHVSRDNAPGLYAYRPERQVTASMTAEGMFAQQLLGRPRDDPRMETAADYVSRHLPDWDEANTYFWYYATLALFQHQGPKWSAWNRALTEELLAHQRHDGAAAGSWDPDGQWAHLGGRVYQTALCSLMLEVYYRYLPIYAAEMPDDTIGTIRGTVTGGPQGTPLSGATVRVDLPNHAAVNAVTGPAGRYELFVPEVPDFFAVSASSAGHIPGSRNVDAAVVRGQTLVVDFELERESRHVVSIEAVPDVHHLGDNRFEGRINSQFQKESEGDRFEAEFEVKGAQRPPAGVAVEVHLLAKGVQRSHKIAINGTVLDDRLDDAPRDGSFGPFVASFDARLLKVGRNTIEIIAKPSTSDIDDFEFVNVQIHLAP